jgi:hypothetical protein
MQRARHPDGEGDADGEIGNVSGDDPVHNVPFLVCGISVVSVITEISYSCVFFVQQVFFGPMQPPGKELCHCARFPAKTDP